MSFEEVHKPIALTGSFRDVRSIVHSPLDKDNTGPRTVGRGQAQEGEGQRQEDQGEGLTRQTDQMAEMLHSHENLSLQLL